jgi:starch phosphorylase
MRVANERFVRLANSQLAGLATDATGDFWLTDLERPSDLESFVDDPIVGAELSRITAENKEDLASILLGRHRGRTAELRRRRGYVIEVSL